MVRSCPPGKLRNTRTKRCRKTKKTLRKLRSKSLKRQKYRERRGGGWKKRDLPKALKSRLEQVGDDLYIDITDKYDKFDSEIQDWHKVCVLYEFNDKTGKLKEVGEWDLHTNKPLLD